VSVVGTVPAQAGSIPAGAILLFMPALPAGASTSSAYAQKGSVMKAATLTLEWDRLGDPTDDDVLAMFGQKAVTTVDGQPDLEWNSADLAWDWLRKWGFQPLFASQYKRLPVVGFVRPVTIHWAKEE
jgi:hypothetical protein